MSPSEQLAEYMRVHYNALFDYGLKLTQHDEDLTKDAIQDVFTAFWQRRHGRICWYRCASPRTRPEP